MGKLLGHQLKRHFSKNYFLLLAPFIFALLGFLSYTISPDGESVVFGLSFLCLSIIYCAAGIVIILDDYNMFYGKTAMFYQSIPVSPAGKTFSRLFYYLITFLVYSIIYGLGLFTFLGVAATAEGASISDLKEISEDIIDAMNGVGMDMIGIVLLLFVVVAFYVASKFIFSISLGSEKSLRRIGFAGPVLVYIGLSILNIFLLSFLSRIDYSLFSTNNINLVNGGMLSLVGIIASAILLTLTSLEVKHRTSVN
ncbi:hypothetical protein [Peptoniphilus obesi]|uniref:hypothetical protein n=1 Tax=Peptoniphilus obesi TaxID=1472765 RepID=UPI0004B96AFC|nr:hypothetical protein [Peptoniphilus obesi]